MKLILIILILLNSAKNDFIKTVEQSSKPQHGLVEDTSPHKTTKLKQKNPDFFTSKYKTPCLT